MVAITTGWQNPDVPIKLAKTSNSRIRFARLRSPKQIPCCSYGFFLILPRLVSALYQESALPQEIVFMKSSGVSGCATQRQQIVQTVLRDLQALELLLLY